MLLAPARRVHTLLAPDVERVVQRRLQFDLLMIIPAVEVGKAVGDRLEPTSLGHRVEVGRDVDGVDDLRQRRERRVVRGRSPLIQWPPARATAF